MSEPQQVEHKTDASFPRRGRNYQPLPNERTLRRVQAHGVQTIQATPEQVYNVYAEPRLLHLWQEGVVSVTETGKRRLHWLVEDPRSGKQHEFDSEIVETDKGKRHVSRILSGPLKDSTYVATFEPHPSGRGTVFTMLGDFRVPGGFLANNAAAVVSRSPARILEENVRHLKQLLEAGEIPRVQGQPEGPRKTKDKLLRYLIGEDLPVPPGTTDRFGSHDLAGQEQNDGGFASTAVLVAVPVIAAAAVWGLFARKAA